MPRASAPPFCGELERRASRLVARSTDDGRGSKYGVGERVFKFGYGRIESIEGNKLTIDFERAGRKKVLDSFVSEG